ncbi:reverse transcriptase domain-containing protein [Tanacetum coccineum]
MADFLPEVDTPATITTSKKSTTHVKPTGHDKGTWTIHTDGASIKVSSGAGIVLRSPSGHDFTYALKFDFEASNNEAKYKALLAGLRIAKTMEVKRIKINGTSLLITRLDQAQNKGPSANHLMAPYLQTQATLDLGESTEDFVQRFKAESRHVKGAPECMRISGFMHGIANPELIKRLHDNIPKSVDEMMRVTTTFLKGEVAASDQESAKIRVDTSQVYTPHKIPK